MVKQNSIVMDLSLEGRTAIVTGGSMGIGFGIAEALAKEGADLVICARHRKELEDAADKLRTHGSKVLVVEADLTDSGDIDKVVEQATTEFETIDILVNNAGTVGANGKFDETSMEEWRAVFDLNLFAVVELTMKVVPLMQKRGWGRIINISSENGTQPYPDMIHYSATKGAIDNFTKGLSKEYASDGILVNAISPGTTYTPLVDHEMKEIAEEHGITREEATVRFLEEKRPHVELGRTATVDEIGAVAAFLASEKASFVNGANYRVDGGSVAAE